MSTREIIDESTATIVRKGKKHNSLIKKIQAALADPELDEANAWIDISCVNCGKSYQYNVRTGKAR